MEYQVRARSIDGTVWAMKSPGTWTSQRKHAYIFTNDQAQARVLEQRARNVTTDPDDQVGQLTIVTVQS